MISKDFAHHHEISNQKQGAAILEAMDLILSMERQGWILQCGQFYEDSLYGCFAWVIWRRDEVP